MSGESIRRLLAGWARRAGIRVPVRPHGLRHAGCTAVAAAGSLAALMSYGGWASLSAASRYLDKRDEERQQALALVEL